MKVISCHETKSHGDQLVRMEGSSFYILDLKSFADLIFKSTF